MAFTIVLSGPGGFTAQARKALTDAGFAPHDKTVDHNLPDEPTIDWISVEGDDIDAAHAAVAPLGWGLRLHMAPSMLTAPLQSDVDADAEKMLRRIVREEFEAIRSES